MTEQIVTPFEATTKKGEKFDYQKLINDFGVCEITV
jgi:hypothetical protein